MNHLNHTGASHAASLIAHGKIKNSDHWSPPTAEQENEYISRNGLAKFGLWHLGVDPGAGEQTKGRYSFPFTSDFEKADYAGLRACITRAAQAGYADIEEQARALYEEAGKKLNPKSDPSSVAAALAMNPPNSGTSAMLSLASIPILRRVEGRNPKEFRRPNLEKKIPPNFGLPPSDFGLLSTLRSIESPSCLSRQPVTVSEASLDSQAATEDGSDFGLRPSDFPSERLVPLHDGRMGLRGGLHVEVRSPDTRHSTLDTSPTLDFIASDETLDRYNEVISAGGWRLENYRRNPVFQNAHQYGDIIFTLGKALVTEVRTVGRRPSGGERKALFQRIEFATDVNPMARIAYGLYKGGFLKAVSVGFIPLRWEDNPSSSASASASSSSLSSLPSVESPRRRYLEQELLEVSAVGIPANPNALVLGLKAGAVEASDLRELADLLNSQLSTKHHSALCIHHSEFPRAAARANTGALGAGSNEAQIIKLLRELRTILKRA